MLKIKLNEHGLPVIWQTTAYYYYLLLPATKTKYGFPWLLQYDKSDAQGAMGTYTLQVRAQNMYTTCVQKIIFYYLKS